MRSGRVPIMQLSRPSIGARPRPPAGRASTKRAPAGSPGSHHSRRLMDSAEPPAPRRARCRTPAPCDVSRRAYGSKIRSRHSARDARALVLDADAHDALDDAASRSRPSCPAGAYFTAFSSRCSSICRRRAGSARTWSRRDRTSVVRWCASSGASSVTSSPTIAGEVRRSRPRRPGPGRRGRRRGSSRRAGPAARSGRACRVCHAGARSGAAWRRATSGRRAAAPPRAGPCRRGRRRAASGARG